MVTSQGDFHHPYKVHNQNYKENKEKVLKAISNGMSPKDACIMVFGILERQWYRWMEFVEDDIANGFDETESALIDLFLSMAKEEMNLRQQLEKKANSLALNEDNVEMLKFLLERRHGYTKQTKKDVDVAVKEEVPIKFEFVDMTPTENEE